MGSSALKNYRWYHGNVNRSATESLLMGREQGTFLVRDSSSSEGDFVLSVSENKKVSHYIINNKENHYKIGEQTFADIPSIISFYRNHFLDTTTLIGAVERKLKVVACYNFDGRDPGDLPFRKHDVLNIVSQDEELWWTAENDKGETGTIPVPYIEVIHEDQPPSLPYGRQPLPGRPVSNPPHIYPAGPNINAYYDPYNRDLPDNRHSNPEPYQPRRPIEPPRPTRPGAPLLARAVIDRVCTPYDKNQIPFKKGDLVKVTKQNDNGFWEGELHGKTGEFPMSHVVLIDPDTMQPLSNGL